MKLRCLPALLAAAVLAGVALASPAAPAARAQAPAFFTFETGAHPFGTPVSGPDGNLYGTTSEGGNNKFGTLYRLTPAGVLTTLASFTGPNGSLPTAPLVLAADGCLYGTTTDGFQGRTLFRLSPAGVLTTLHRFTADGPPSALTLGPDGNLYGAVTYGGANGVGAIFRLTPTTGALATVAHFNEDTTGSYPVAPLLLGRDGNLYGAASYGGAHYSGTLFRVTPAGALTALFHFDRQTTGRPGEDALVEDAAGNLLGAQPGDSSRPAAVFRFSPGGDLSTLVSFPNSDSFQFTATLTPGPGGDFYGVTSGGVADATLFRLTPAGALTTLATFTSAVGLHPTGLRLAADGCFYGAATHHGTYGRGAVFRFDPAAGAGGLTAVHAFGANTDGTFPRSGLIRAPDGNFYGAASQGGAAPGDNGLLFRLTPAGVRTTLAAFTGPDGRTPQGALCLDAAGNLLGATAGGGANDRGTVFRVKPTGELTTLWSFRGLDDGRAPDAGLLPGPGGAFYGTTSAAGAGGRGTIFRLDANGTLTTLHAFQAPNGDRPAGELTYGPDGALYGVTSSGGAQGVGTVFRFTPADSTLTILFSFNGADGRNPRGPVAFAADGSLYGTASSGGPGPGPRYGTVFRLTPAGALTTLATFTGLNGAYPFGGLARGADGHLYGTTYTAGAGNSGTLFRVTPATGEVLTLHGFDGATDGVGPEGTPVIGPDGALYGTATHTVWRFPLPTAAGVWRLRYFQTAAPVGDAADDADPDGDDLENILERALGLNPTVANGAAGRPVTTNDGGGLFLFTTKGPDVADLVFSAEASADLQTWSTADVTVVQDNVEHFKARDTGTGPRRFLRLRVTRP